MEAPGLCPPWQAACLSYCCRNSPPTSGGGWCLRGGLSWGLGCPQEWAVPWFLQGGQQVQFPSRQGLSEQAGAWQLRASMQMLGESLVFPKDKWVASETSFRWRWLIFRATTFVCRLCASAPLFPRTFGCICSQTPLLRA